MEMEVMFTMIKGYLMLGKHFIDIGLCERVHELDLYIDLCDVMEDIVEAGFVYKEDWVYLSTKFLGSESYYVYNIENNIVDKKAALMTKIENNIRDEDCYEIKYKRGDSTIILKRNKENKWVKFEMIG